MLLTTISDKVKHFDFGTVSNIWEMIKDFFGNGSRTMVKKLDWSYDLHPFIDSIYSSKLIIPTE